ncbi:MAG: c-type cytochrome [Gemmatimonadota bacterium]
MTTSNELHVPVNRTIDLRMKSADVIHSFWVPQFAGKRDIFPNRETRLWFTANVAGEFPGACAEFCGTEHGRMDFYLMVDSVEQFKSWTALRLADSTMMYSGAPKVAADSVPLASLDPKVAQGKQLFTSKTCVVCHSVSAMNPLKGQIGPNLSGIGTRKMIGAGWLPNTDDNLREWIEHTQKVKPDVLMKGLPPISDDEAAALIAYLRTLH